MTPITAIRFIDIVIGLTIATTWSGTRTTTVKTGPTARAGETESSKPIVERGLTRGKLFVTEG
jgi:hypothetical protein